MDLILIIGLSCFGYLWAGNVDFLEDFKNCIGLGQKQKDINFKNKVVNYIWKFIHKLFNCNCIAFWVTLLLTGSIWLGFITYVGSELLYVIIKYFKNNTFYN